MKETPFDIAIIGGGVVGCWCAYDAALRGFNVALFEKADFGSGTSGRSSKLIHGGLRYLQYFQFHFVFEALSERHILRHIAPQLVSPMPFLLPIWRGSKTGYGKMRLGMWLYDSLSLFRTEQLHRMLRPHNVRAIEPQLRQENLLGAAFYHDCFVDDARLTLALAKTSYDLGVSCGNYLRVREIKKEESMFRIRVADVIGGEEFDVRAARIINASGVWTDEVAGLAGMSAAHLRITKGIHVIVSGERLSNRNTVVLTAPDGRFIYAIPWGNFRLIGTTENDYGGSLEEPYATREEVAYLLGTVNDAFTSNLSINDVVSTYAGLRPLVEDRNVSAYRVSREHRILESDGFFSIMGGKLTTGRRMAQEVLDRVVRSLVNEKKRGKCVTHQRKLDAWNFDYSLLWKRLREKNIPEDISTHLISSYGKEVSSMHLDARDEMAGRICPPLPYLISEIPFCVQEEFAQTLEDFMLRRTRIVNEDSKQGLECASLVVEEMGRLLGWDRERKETEIERYRKNVARTRLYKA
jgi:glycerol-3-phosphate dehydrogenase